MVAPHPYVSFKAREDGPPAVLPMENPRLQRPRTCPRGGWSLIAAILMGILATGGEVWGEQSRINPIDLFEGSDLVLLIELPAGASPGEFCKVRILGRVSGLSSDEDTVTFRYPLQSIEESFIKPEKELRLVAFFKRTNEKVLVPTSAVHKIGRTIGQKEVSEEVVSPFGCSSFFPVNSADAKGTENVLKGLLDWKRNSKAEREKAIIAVLALGGAARAIGMEVLLSYGNFDWEDRNCVSDSILEGILTCLNDRQCRSRAVGLVSMSIYTRKDMVPYLVDLLDDPECCHTAVARLEGRNGYGPGPVLDASLTLSEKISRLKQWWSEDGSKSKKYTRFVPRVSSESVKMEPENPTKDGSGETAKETPPPSK